MSATRARWGFGLLLMIGSATVAGADGDDSCTAARTERVDALSTIGLSPVDLPPRLAALPMEAAQLWNEAPCVASDRPRIVLGEGERTIAVRWIHGTSISADGVCGSFAGREIRLYAFARDPLDGRLHRCGERERLVEILAHELGHALGLFDQRSPDCNGRIMGQLVRRADGSIAARRVHAEECAAVDLRFQTLAERLELARDADIQVAVFGPGPGPWATALP